MKLTIIDYGNYNIKFKSDNLGLISSKHHTNFEPNEEAFNRIEVEGKKYYIGVGKYSLEYIKIDKESLIPQILYCINEANQGNNITTDLAILLPIEQMAMKEELKKLLERRFYSSTINGKQVNIRIEKIVVLPEAQVARFSLSEDKQSEDLLLVDIGSRTTNIVATSQGELVLNITRKIGVLNLYERLMKQLNSQGEILELEDIEPQLKRNRIVLPEEMKMEFLKEVLNSFKSEVNIANHDVMFSGGGSLVLQSVIDKIEGVQLHNDCLYANLLGAEIVAKELLR